MICRYYTILQEDGFKRQTAEAEPFEEQDLAIEPNFEEAPQQRLKKRHVKKPCRRKSSFRKTEVCSLCRIRFAKSRPRKTKVAKKNASHKLQRLLDSRALAEQNNKLDISIQEKETNDKKIEESENNKAGNVKFCMNLVNKINLQVRLHGIEISLNPYNLKQ